MSGFTNRMSGDYFSRSMDESVRRVKHGLNGAKPSEADIVTVVFAAVRAGVRSGEDHYLFDAMAFLLMHPGVDIERAIPVRATITA